MASFSDLFQTSSVRCQSENLRETWAAIAELEENITSKTAAQKAIVLISLISLILLFFGMSHFKKKGHSRDEISKALHQIYGTSDTGKMKPAMVKKMNDKFKFRKEVKEAKDDEIIVPGIGKYTYKSLKSRLEAQSKDLMNRAKKNEFDRIGKGNLNAFIVM